MRNRSGTSASLSIPDIPNESLPAGRLLRELISHLLRFAVALDGLAHLLVDLPERQAAGSFELVRIVFRHDFEVRFDSFNSGRWCMRPRAPSSATSPRLRRRR